MRLISWTLRSGSAYVRYTRIKGTYRIGMYKSTGLNKAETLLEPKRIYSSDRNSTGTQYNRVDSCGACWIPSGTGWSPACLLDGNLMEPNSNRVGSYGAC
jgi:hypothetical protein